MSAPMNANKWEWPLTLGSRLFVIQLEGLVVA